MDKKIVLVFNETTISQNVRERTHYRERHKANKDIYTLVNFYAITQKPQKPFKNAKLTLYRFSNRSLDYDGLVASFKPWVDGLIHAGVIIDDNFKVTGKWIVDQFYRPKSKGPMIKIIIEETEEGIQWKERQPNQL